MEKDVTKGPSARTTRYALATIGLFISSVFLLAVATYPSFFFFNLFEGVSGLRMVLLVLCTIGWISIAFGPVVIFFMLAAGYSKAVNALPWVALLWPASLILNHLALLLEQGNAYFGYLVQYPIFIATDILLPLLLVALWLEFRYAGHHIHKAASRS